MARGPQEGLTFDFDALRLGNLGPGDKNLMRAFAKLMVENLVPSLKRELSAELTHNTLTMRERRAGMINAPRVFPAEPVLRDMDRSTQSRFLTYWPNVFKDKFSGSWGKGRKNASPEIAYWLTRMNGSQYFFPLSESEFCLLYTSPSPRDKRQPRMPSSA